MSVIIVRKPLTCLPESEIAANYLASFILQITFLHVVMNITVILIHTLYFACHIVINIEFLIIRNIRLEDIRSKMQNVCGFRFIAINLVCDSCRLHHFASRDAKAVAF